MIRNTAILFLLAPLALLLSLSGCRNEINEVKVKKMNSRSLEMVKEYITQQKENYQYLLKRQIKKVDKSIEQLRSTASDNGQVSDPDIRASIQALETEKEVLTLQLGNLIEKSDNSIAQVELQWQQYSMQLDTTLLSMQRFLNNMDGLRQADLK